MSGLVMLATTTAVSNGYRLDPTALLTWITCLATLSGLGIGMMKYGRRIMQMVEDFNGTKVRPGVPERPGVMARLQTLDEQVAAVHTEVNYNHGTTIKDAVARIETDVKDLHKRLDKV